MTGNIVMFETAAELAAGAADRIAASIRSRAGGVVTLGMAGGSTPSATYAELVERDVPWNLVYAWIGDERFVPPEDPDNNGSMVQRTILGETEATLFAVPWWDGATPEELAAEYERTLVEVMDNDGDGPIPDIILAGIGDDGHTLSLFPGTDALTVTDRWFVANEVPQKDTWRLTATYPLVGRAREVYVLVSGAGKAEALREIMSPVDYTPLPARRLMDHNDNVTWLVDRAAAAHLEIT